MLSIIIVNSDGTDLTLACLESIYRYPPAEPFEIVLVDNASTVPCLPAVNERYPLVRTFSAPERQGFSKNYNLGMRQAQGDYVLILNNDTLVQPGALTALVEAMRAHDAYGLAGPQLLTPAGKIQTDCARRLPTPGSYLLTQFLLDRALPTGKLWDRFRRGRLARRGSGPVACITGSAMIARRAVLDTVGLLDEGFDFYYEDVEWCHRMQKRGYQVAYIAEARITHLGDQSLSKVKEWAKQSEYRSALRYFRQYHRLSALGAWGLWLVTVASYLGRAVWFWIYEKLSGQLAHGQAYWNLFRWIIQERPTAEE